MDQSTALKALKRYFGYDSFRPMQAEIIGTILQDRDATVLMPTGGGKSICFQIPGIILPGCCLVVSPLISLMKDQVEGLLANGVRAAYLNSSLSIPEQRSVEDRFFNGALDLLYVSPEKLTSSSFLPLLKRSKVNLFAIDEAHCISAWGHDFRQEYTQLQFLKKEFPKVPIIALTATADKLTRDDIIRQLGLQHPASFIASFDRPNIRLEVRPSQKRFEQMVQFIQEHPDQSGIIYCLSRKSTEELAQKLVNIGYKAGAYHAGLSSRERSSVQEAFIEDRTPIVCATIAFGMGIDKSNVRWIIHYNLPKNLEGFYQEIGRAGRDGVKADTLLFYSFHDVMVLREIIEDNNSEQTQIHLAKLDRMRQYAEAMTCRRRVLLSYFGEDLGQNCGNCDICQNPPQQFDGTILAQKALSAIYRLKQQAPMGTVIDVLRGSGKKELKTKGYDRIKTFGQGREIPFSHWQQYFLQLLHLGYIEIAYQQKNQVILTPAAREVLFNNRPVELIQPATVQQRKEKQKEEARRRTTDRSKQEELFQLLRQLRKRLAQQYGLPPYQIFSDATLLEMAEKRPLEDSELLKVAGVGEHKLKKYGDYFMDAIIEYVNQNNRSSKSSTFQLTLTMHKKGLTVEEISRQRGLNQGTIISHLALLYEQGHPIDISDYIQEEEIKAVTNAIKYIQKPIKLKDIYIYLDEQISFDKIRLALAYHQRNHGLVE